MQHLIAVQLNPMIVDYALAVEHLLGVAEYGSASSYDELQRTWRDARPLPSHEQLVDAWLGYISVQDALVQAQAVEREAKSAKAQQRVRQRLLDRIDADAEQLAGGVRTEQMIAILTRMLATQRLLVEWVLDHDEDRV